MDRMFRLLNADEIDCRVATVSDKGVSLLLYKDARADMIILDETVGPMRWQRRHTRDNANCIVSIMDDSGNWIAKEDTGTESNTEKEKGLASDSFKRACTNWGIGRELYTAPFIWIAAEIIEWETRNGKRTPRTRFKVAEIGYDDKCRINHLKIVTNKNAVVYELGQQPQQQVAPQAPQQQVAPQQATGRKIGAIGAKALESLIEKAQANRAELLASYGVKSINDLTSHQGKELYESLKERVVK